MTLVSGAWHPVIPGFHPDPTVCRVGADYYLANSSFEYLPAVPIWHSRDLVSWEQIGNALTDPAQFRPGAAGRGIFAPTLRHHADRFWLIVTDVDGGRGGQLVFSAVRAEGPWGMPTVLSGVDGIDPDLVWDARGACYVTYCATDGPAARIMQVRVDLAAGRVREQPRRLWSGTGLAHPEGPHVFAHGGAWYLLVAEGGTERGHAISVARGPSPTGPFRGHPGNPVFSRRSTAHPVQNAGHADLVETATGDWAAVYLGVRPRGTTPSFHTNGRETFVAGVDWVDGWPVFRPERYAFETSDHGFRDDFAGPTLHPRWVTPGPAAAAATADPDERLSVGVFARATDPHWTFRVVLRPSAGPAAVLVRMDDRYRAGARVAGDRVEAFLTVAGVTTVLGVAPRPVGDAAECAVELRSVPAACGGPDDVEIAVATRVLGRFDGRLLSTEVAGGFTGRMLGLRVAGGAAAVRVVDYRPAAVAG